MVMDPGVRELSGMISGFNFGDIVDDGGSVNTIKPEDPESFFTHNILVDGPISFPSAASAIATTTINGRSTPLSESYPRGDSPEDPEIISDIALTYISKMLMEEDMDDNRYLYQGDSALRAAEKPFYDILGQEYPPLDRPPLYPESSGSPDDSSSGQHGNSSSSGSHGALFDSGYPFDVDQPSLPQFGSFPIDYPYQPYFGSNNGVSTVLDRVEETHFMAAGDNDLFSESQPLWQFKRGVEEANKFLPDQSNLVIDPDPGSLQMLSVGVAKVEVDREEQGSLLNAPRNRKNPHNGVSDLEEGRSVKHSAINPEEDVRSEIFDQVLLCHHGKPNDYITTLREALQTGVNKSSKAGQTKGSTGGKSRGKRQAKKEVVDLRTLLIHCAQAVAADDRRSAGELLKQIRQHSSPLGDGTQRLAHCFADGLEARLAGTGSEKYHSFIAKRQSATAILKAYHLYLAACPFKKVSHFVANQTILNVAEKAKKLHIVDFGIYFGFQWPCLIQRLASRPGGPPKLRITGIDVPQPGFRPTERIEQTGQRLADYCKSFGVDFEYHPIASKWETIQVEDLNIDKDEVLVVNSLYRFRNLVDETVVVDSPRNIVLNTIRKMNPEVFIHGVVNGAFSAPFFVTRFREALFHFSALFDMLDANVPRDHPERLLIETEIFGRDAMNVIACEGAERVERPETYKQWQVRNLRAGFSQLALDPAIMKKSRDRVKSNYNKDFVIDEDSRWLLQGWKGRVIYAVSFWKPNRN